VLLLGDGLQHIARTRDLRQVELSLDLGFGGAALSTPLAARGRLPLAGKKLPHPLGFIDLDGAGVCLLLGDSDLGKHVENGLRLDFQFARQIVDSNLLLLHPPCVPPICPARSS